MYRCAEWVWPKFQRFTLYFDNKFGSRNMESKMSKCKSAENASNKVYENRTLTK